LHFLNIIFSRKSIYVYNQLNIILIILVCVNLFEILPFHTLLS